MSVHPVTHTWPENGGSLKNPLECSAFGRGYLPLYVGSLLGAWCVSCLTSKEIFLFSWVMGRVVSSEWHSTCACLNGRCTPNSADPSDLQEHTTGLSLSVLRECSMCLVTLWSHITPLQCFILAAEPARSHVTFWMQPSLSALGFLIAVKFFHGEYQLVFNSYWAVLRVVYPVSWCVGFCCSCFCSSVLCRHQRVFLGITFCLLDKTLLFA